MSVEGIIIETAAPAGGHLMMRVQVGGVVSAWRAVMKDEEPVLMASRAAADGGPCVDDEAVYRLIRACWPLAEALEGI